MQDVECIVIGAGVVGLAIARELAMRGHEVLVLESEGAIGTGTSARNSEVIHAGLYYPAPSLKAQLCIIGNPLLYAYCKQRHVPHRRCGKLIIACDHAQRDQLEQLHRSAIASGAHGLLPLDASQIQAREPALRCVAALESTATGIIDSHALMLALQGDAEAHGATVALRAPVVQVELLAQGLRVSVAGQAPARLTCAWLVNAAGHGAPPLAARIDGLPAHAQVRGYFAKGSYFTLAGRSPFQQLIYPMPEPGGLGVHLTLDLHGRARFGPDVEWVAQPDYHCEPAHAARFAAAIRRYWPGLPDGALQPGYCGVRPKISGPGEAAADFRIDGPSMHGIAGLVNLFGIESPGLTCCLSIARHVAALLADGRSATTLPV
ncbi:NAD(P)/FAD-dependent oxidoreductase [Xanthomonas arboricola]|uniref:L-2-hydroxyglutarate dehydrogenase n=1 Tax=Xanthomonas arboricola TaxID=56448 RepID=A0AAU9I135_9XANT|nr:NAD(P)/FAD-dependent oxidoreductase [Xanthomonas arboricola]CAE6767379.1 L-2-hydroxyglutarate dehydrogenase [Xanthomonas arboricola]CAE6767401.1 L-2-hydroxyglutarate dehydrogenase [Xanthomonas arboricola]